MQSPALSLNALSFAYPGADNALDDINLTIEAGSFVALLGPSGCGKSTLLRLAAGLLKPSQGEIAWGAGLGRERAFVFQKPSLLPWRTVADNIALPLELLGRDTSKEAIYSTLQRLGLEGFEEALPGALSGGMAMRVSLGRALITEPRLLLMDEPFGALDDLTRQDLGEFVHSLWRREGWTCLFVTHNVFEAAALADRILIMSPRPGRITGDIQSPLPKDRPPEFKEQADYQRFAGQVLKALREGTLCEAGDEGDAPPQEAR